MCSWSDPSVREPGGARVYVRRKCSTAEGIDNQHSRADRSPTAGGQYHWVSEFAPPGMQKILSYLTGEFE